MFVFDWFWSALHSLGLANKRARLVLLGLDNAGKTTLLHMLRDDHLAQHRPTHHPTTETLEIEGINFTAHDVGGHEAVRPIWNQYYESTDAVIYVVDASDTERINQSKDALDKLLVICNPKIPILVLANKVDAPGALSEPQFRAAMGLEQTTGKGDDAIVDYRERPLEVFMCSIIERAGYGAGVQWLSRYV